MTHDAPTRAWREPPSVNYARVRQAMHDCSRDLQAAHEARVAAMVAEIQSRGGRVCGTRLPAGDTCPREARRWMNTWACLLHSPARLAGREITTPDPDLTMEGLRRRWYADRGLPLPPPPKGPPGETIIDARAVASGKRRSSPTRYRAAQAATGRTTP